MIQFWINEFVAHSQIPISGNHGALFQIKGQGQFWDLKNCGLQEEKRRGAGRRSLSPLIICTVDPSPFLDWALGLIMTRLGSAHIDGF